MTKLLCLVLLLATIGCTQSDPVFVSTKPANPTLVTTTPASVSDCSNGGTVVRHGLDSNGNHVLDPSEVQGSTVVCNGLTGANGNNGGTGDKGDQGTPGSNGSNGTNGSNGHNSLISVVNSAPSCLNGGIVIFSGLDVNDNSVLDSGEASNTNVVCNGANGLNGTNGSNGTNGVDGHNALVDMIGSSGGGGSNCSNGGVTLFSGTDQNDNGILELSEIALSKDVCNGMNGTNGSNGSNGTNGLNGINAPYNPYSVTSLVDPCGKQGNQNSPDEIFMLLANGQLIADFSKNMGGERTRLSSIIPNANSSFSGLTTDETGCTLTISRDGSNHMTMTTSNGVGNMSWTLNP